MPIFKKYDNYDIEIDENGNLFIVYPGASTMIMEGTIHLNNFSKGYGINVNDAELVHDDRVKPGRSQKRGKGSTFDNSASIQLTRTESSPDCYKIYDFKSNKLKEDAETGYYIAMALYPYFVAYFSSYSKEYFENVLKPTVANFVAACRNNPNTIKKEAKRLYFERNRKDAPSFNQMKQ